MAISENWASLLTPGLRSIFFKQRDALAAGSRVPFLFHQETSTKAAETFLSGGGFGDWQTYEGRIQYDDIEQLYETTLTHVEYVRGFKVQRKLVDDDLYNVINAKPKGLATAAERTREKHAASVFNNAFSGSYLGGDSKALCASDHPLGPLSGASGDNSGTSALSYDAIVSTRQAMRAFTDDRGELISVNPDTLLVPPELEETAFAVLKTVNKVDITDYHANFVQSQIKRLIVWDYLTDSDNWFLIDSALASMYLWWLDRVPLEFTLDPQSDFNLEAKYRGYMRYSYGWIDWSWIYGHTV